MAKAACQVPADKLDLYEKIVAAHPDVERKGAANPYTSVNGHMFSFMTKAGKLALRLPGEQREAFLKKYPDAISVHYDTVMKEYVELPDAMLKRTTTAKKLFAQSYEYASSLKPKATTRKKPAKKASSTKNAPKKHK